MTARIEKIRQSYQKSSLSQRASCANQLGYHLGRMMEFTWNVNEYAKLKSRSTKSKNKVAGLMSTDLFSCVEVCAEFLNEAITTQAKSEDGDEIQECWSAFYRLLVAVRKNSGRIQDDIALKVFLMLFIASSIMKEAAVSSSLRKNALSEDDVFLAKVFPLTGNECTLTKTFPSPIFGTNLNLSGQLKALSKNLIFHTDACLLME